MVLILFFSYAKYGTGAYEYTTKYKKGQGEKSALVQTQQKICGNLLSHLDGESIRPYSSVKAQLYSYHDLKFLATKSEK
jgi:hypothetical protein